MATYSIGYGVPTNPAAEEAAERFIRRFLHLQVRDLIPSLGDGAAAGERVAAAIDRTFGGVAGSGLAPESEEGGAVVDFLRSTLLANDPMPPKERHRQRMRKRSAMALANALQRHLPRLMDRCPRSSAPGGDKERKAETWFAQAISGCEESAAECRRILARMQLLQEIRRGGDPERLAVTHAAKAGFAALEQEGRKHFHEFVEAVRIGQRMQAIEGKAIVPGSGAPSRSRIEKLRREAGIKPAQVKAARSLLPTAADAATAQSLLVELEQDIAMLRRLARICCEPLLADSVASDAKADRQALRSDGVLSWPLFIHFAEPVVVALGGKSISDKQARQQLRDFLRNLDEPQALGFACGIPPKSLTRRASDWLKDTRRGKRRIPASALQVLAARRDDGRLQGSEAARALAGEWLARLERLAAGRAPRVVPAASCGVPNP